MSREEAGIAAASGTQLPSDNGNIQHDLICHGVGVQTTLTDLFVLKRKKILTRPTCGECLHFLQHDVIGQMEHQADKLGASG